MSELNRYVERLSSLPLPDVFNLIATIKHLKNIFPDKGVFEGGFLAWMGPLSNHIKAAVTKDIDAARQSLDSLRVALDAIGHRMRMEPDITPYLQPHPSSGDTDASSHGRVLKGEAFLSFFDEQVQADLRSYNSLPISFRSSSTLVALTRIIEYSPILNVGLHPYSILSFDLNPDRVVELQLLHFHVTQQLHLFQRLLTVLKNHVKDCRIQLEGFPYLLYASSRHPVHQWATTHESALSSLLKSAVSPLPFPFSIPGVSSPTMSIANEEQYQAHKHVYERAQTELSVLRDKAPSSYPVELPNLLDPLHQSTFFVGEKNTYSQIV